MSKESIVFGLTGSIGTGKSTVSKILSEEGVSIIDADLIAREVVEPETNGLVQITNAFGQSIINTDGTLNRKELGSIIFSNALQKAKLESIMQPLIVSKTMEHLDLLVSQKRELICYDAALLVEMGLLSKFKPLIFVTCDVGIQLDRVMRRNNLTKEEAEQRINAQDIENKIRCADYIIENNTSFEALHKKVLSVLDSIRSK